MPDRSYYLGNEYSDKLQAYKTLMMSVAIYLGAEPEQAMTDVQEIIDFEIELANVSSNLTLSNNIHITFIVARVQRRMISVDNFF